MPAIGLGTWQSEPGVVGEVVKNAIKVGYRHIDCATRYGNEKEIGAGLKELFDSNVVKRKDIFVTSKLWNDMHRPNDVEVALTQTLNDLGLEYLDLYLMHWPVALEKNGVPIPIEELPISETWKAMEKCVDKGIVKHIGVSNFSIKKLKDLLQVARIKPSTNQVERHPYLQQPKLLEFCQQHGIIITAYSPLGTPGTSFVRGEASVLNDETVKRIAEKHSVTAAQVLLQWGLQSGTSLIPKTTKIHRMKENLHPGFSLAKNEMVEISNIDRNKRYIDGAHYEKPYSPAYLWDDGR